MKPHIKIKDRRIGPGYPAYIVAEMSANHNQIFDEAVKIIETAKNAGADAIKLQTYTPDTLTIDCNNKYFRIGKGTVWEGRKLYDLYREAYTPWEWQPKLKELADKLHIDFFSTPFDFTAVSFLEKMNVPAYKIASFELVDLPLLKCVAKTGKPIIISTGMGSLAEIDEAVRTLNAAGNKKIALLKCTSSYPAPLEDLNLRTIPHLAETFNVPVGLSDHTLGFEAAIVAIALGSCILEKHLTLTRNHPGPDSAFSMEPQEFKDFVKAIRAAEKTIGRVQYQITEREKSSKVFRRSLFVVRDMHAGEEFSEKNVRSIRPASGMHPRYIDEVLGRKAKKDILAGTPLSRDIIA